MINLFEFAVQDKSLQYLAFLFGYMNGVIPVVGVGSPDASSGVASLAPGMGAVFGGTGVSITLMGTMFKTFNGIILAVAVLMVVYTMVMGVLLTAHEGEFMGKSQKFHSLWTPVRIVFGIASLVPTGSGYCVLQLVMMWVIVQGIGAADTLWTTVLNYVNVMGSPYAQATVPNIGYQDALNKIFQGVVCDTSTRVTSADGDAFDQGDSGMGGYFCSMTGFSGLKYCKSDKTIPKPPAVMMQRVYASGGMTPLIMGFRGLCGVVTFCNKTVLCNKASPTAADTLACNACTDELDAMNQIIPLMSQAAAVFVIDDVLYRQFVAQSITSQPHADPDDPTKTIAGKGDAPTAYPFIQAYCDANSISPCIYEEGSNWPDPNQYGQSPSREAVTKIFVPYGLSAGGPAGSVDANFMKTISAQLLDPLNARFADFIKEMTAKMNDGDGLTDDLADAQMTGWIYAGSYYYTIAKMNQNNLKSVMPTLTVSWPNDDNMSPAGSKNFLYTTRNNFTGAAYMIGTGAASGVTMGTTLPSDVSEISNAASVVTDGISSATGEGLSATDSNPLAQAQNIGFIILWVVQIAFVVMVVLLFVSSLVGNISPFVLGTGVINPLGPALTAVYLIIVPAILALFGILLTYGALLSVYLPLVPFIIFTFGAIGWLTSTIETMVAGPLVALGIIAPGGHHEILGKAEPALMLLFNVFLRPSLMIFGMMAAMLLSSVVAGMINDVFWRVAESIGMESPLTLVFFLAAYVTLMITAMNKCFAAIYLIPERVMRWIGGQGDQYGEADAVGESKQAITGAASKAGSGMGTAGDTSKAFRQDRAEREAAKAKEGGKGAVQVDADKKPDGK